MIRIREITDPDLKARVVAKLVEVRGLAIVPEWFELDDADFVDLLNEIRDDDAGLNDDWEKDYQPRWR